MRRVAILVVIALCSGFLVSTPTILAVGQEGADCEISAPDYVLWDCVERPVPIADAFMPEEGLTTVGGKRFQAYHVEFRAINAAVPRIRQEDTGIETEFMIVTVLNGDFVIENNDTRERSIIVDPRDGHSVTLMRKVTEDATGDQRVYEATEDNLPVGDTGDSGSDCVDMCVVPRNEAVQIIAGDTIYALQGAICIWCLQNSLAENAGSTEGALQVAALVEPDPAEPVNFESFAENFSWIQDWDARGGNPVATTSSSQTMMAWAFGPASSCKG